MDKRATTTSTCKSHKNYKWNAQHQPFFVFRLFAFFSCFRCFTFSYLTFARFCWLWKNLEKRNLSSSLLFSCCCCRFISTFFLFIPIKYVVSWLCSEHHKRTMKWTIWKLKLKQKIFFFSNAEEKNRRKTTTTTLKRIARFTHRCCDKRANDAKISAKMTKNKNNLTLMRTRTHTHTHSLRWRLVIFPSCAKQMLYAHYSHPLCVTAITLSQQLLNFFCLAASLPFVRLSVSHCLWLLCRCF